MPAIPPRWNGPNQWYFVTVITHKRQSLFTDTDSCEILKHAFPEERKHHHFRLAGLVILAHHWHALIRPHDGCVIETIVGNIKKKARSDLAAPRQKREPGRSSLPRRLQVFKLEALQHLLVP